MSRTAHRLIEPDEPLWAPHHSGHDLISTRALGFWLYMMSDALIFAGLFAAYAVLDHPHNAAGGPDIRSIVHPIAAYIQTIVVFSSVFTYSLAMVGLKAGNRALVIGGLVVAAGLGAGFIGLELHDFANLIAQGATPQRSGLLSIYFALIATHGLHMAFGILWMLVMIPQVALKGLTTDVVTRLVNLRMFWMFQASIWVCVFVFIYLNGAYR
jgi:cytochrome o ubiquinol oxidase subunit 3